MNYRSASDMARAIRAGLYIVPTDADLVVGIPRSGMLAASLIALHANLKCTGLDAFLSNTPLLTGSTRRARQACITNPRDAAHILLVDDSAASGASMREALESIRSLGYTGRITTCAVFIGPDCPGIDVYMEVVPLPRLFEWNLMHRDYLANCCVDLDGVMCVDPTAEENDDGPNYLRFLDNAAPLLVPTYRVGRIVTSRLEKYRTQTERWLARHNVEYGALDMLDLPDAQARRKARAHAPFKARIYAQHDDMGLFIESERGQAAEIARLAGKQALCISTQELFSPGLTLPYAKQASRRWTAKGLRFLRRLAAGG